MTDNANTPEQAGMDPDLVAKVAEELMASSDASGTQLLGEDGLLTQVTKAVLERALSVETAEHLGYEKGDPAGRGSGNYIQAESGKQRSQPHKIIFTHYELQAPAGR